MDEEIETLMIEVRANTSGFQSDIESMRNTLDTSLIDGFSKAGNILERGLLSAIRKGSLGFDDLKRVALRVLNEIAAQALQSGISNLFGKSSSSGGSGGGIASLFQNVLGSILGSPGRATGGPVAPGSAYLVGERGPELFVPTSSGRVESNTSLTNRGRDVRVSISLSAPRGSEAPVILRRSNRQIASAVVRSMRDL